jgi:pimeloyl-ACP methyl ester carboxylesterase
LTRAVLHLFAILAAITPGIGIAQPPPAGSASADPYLPAREIVGDVNRIVTSDGVQEQMVITLGGTRQAISIRGADRANPILVYVHGGPGAVEMPLAWTFERPWEDFFTVVQWDQRGAGKSYALNDPKTIWFEHSAHMPMIEQPGLVLKALIEDVRPLTGKE